MMEGNPNQELETGEKNSESEASTQNEKPIPCKTNSEELEPLENGIFQSNDNDNKKKCHEKEQAKNFKDQEEQQEQEKEEETPEEKVLRNPLVVKTILRYLKSSSLLKVRRLNKLWLALSTEILQKIRDENEHALRFKFQFCEEPASFVKMCDGVLSSKVKTLESFNRFLSQLEQSGRSEFPCKNFEFQGLDLSHPEIQEFFQLYGSEIRGLRLGFSEKNKKAVSQKSLTDLLMLKAKNVETLTILYAHYSFNFNPNKKVKNQNELIFTLPHLRCLRLYFYSRDHDGGLQSLDHKLIQAAPQLKTIILATPTPFFIIKNIRFDYLTSISKAHLITRMNIRPTVKNIGVLNKFAQSQPHLTHLTLSLKFVDNCELMRSSEYTISFEQFLPFASKLLESSKETLQYLYMPSRKSVSRFLRWEEFPPLEKVREVGFCCGEEIPSNAFKRIFPNAWKLSVMGEEAQSEYKDCGWGSPQAAGSETRGLSISKFRYSRREDEIEIGEIPQITSLKISGCFPEEFYSNLPAIFCNVEKLGVKNDDLLPVLPLIWNLTALPLKVLKLTVPVDVPLQEEFAGPMGVPKALIFPGLDAAITGFEEDACLEMHAIYPKLVEEEILERERVNPSILDLKHLEEIYIKFKVSSDLELPEDILTVVSGAYAFQRMKSELGLKKVQITTEIPPQKHGREISILDSRRRQAEDVLKPLVPFANLTFKLGAIYSESEESPIERNCAF